MKYFNSILFVFLLGLNGCDQCDSEKHKAQHEENEPAKVSIVGKWGWENAFIEINDSGIKFFLNGEFQDYPSGSYKMISENQGVLENGDKFFVEIKEGELMDIVFANGVGDYDMPKMR